eukprot:GFUD01031480.1.p1 GENE.GFUD01031480.1~~GFUD01031480.1.p1  ORF type:complete len:372 (-),score=93.34 GFUD01031480.1:415-1530(-)
MYSKLENQPSMGVLRTKDWLLSLADFLWSSVVVAPLVVLYWRGSWDLLDDLVYPPPEEGSIKLEDAPHPAIQRQLSGLVCYMVGLLVRICLDLSKYHIGEFLKTKSKYIRLSCSWIFNAVYALAGVSFWRGVWFLMKLDIGVGTVQLLVVLCGSLAVLIFTKVPKSLISSPLAISLDKHEVTFQNGTFFRKTPEAGCWFLIDVIFTNLVIRQLIVFCWWSLWSLENKILFKNYMGMQDFNVSTDSLFMGYAGAILTVGLDQLVRKVTTTKLYIMKPAATLVTILAFFSSVNVWRGVWSMLDHYFLHGIDPDENYVIGHVAGIVALTGIMVANTISNDSIVLDSETENAVNIGYWRQKPRKEEHEEMVPIIE